MVMAQKKINKRGLTSFFTLFGFLIMSITGLILYIVPAGRIAYWVNWELIDLTKTDWGNIHIISSIFFIVAGAFHIYFNWRILIHYFKDKVTQGIKLKKELLITSIISIVIVVGSLFQIPPISYLLDLNEYIKDSWIMSDEYEPPFGHAELLSLTTFTKKMDIDLGKALNELESNGVKIDSVEATLEDIAKDNRISPMDLYMIIKKYEIPDESTGSKIYTPELVEVEFAGTNIGNKSLKSICSKINVEVSVALDKLKKNGIESESDETLKKAAEKINVNPIEILKILLVENYQIGPTQKNQ